jgi:hypothetical protein
MKKAVILKVTDNCEDFDESSNAAVIILDEKHKALILKLSKKVKEIKKELGDTASVYDIRIFDYSPSFLSTASLNNEDEDLDDEVQNKDLKFVSIARAKKLAELDTVRVDCVLLQVSDDSFFWTGYYKHTDVRFSTVSLLISDLDKF